MAVGRINGVAVLPGYFYKEMYWHFAGTKKNGRINEVAVRRGSTVYVAAMIFCELISLPNLWKNRGKNNQPGDWSFGKVIVM